MSSTSIKTIEKEKRKKRNVKTWIITGAILYAYAVLVYFHLNAYQALDRRHTFIESLNAAFTRVFTHPLEIFPLRFENLQMLFAITLFGGAALAMVILDKQLTKHDDSETVNGEAHLMTVEELGEYNKKRTEPFGKEDNSGEGNMILSKDLFLALNGRKTRRNCNVLVIGGSGAGKSRFFASPNILQYNANFVITDPSGEMLNDYGKALEDNGYKVKVFNLTDVYRSNRYNPFHYIKEEKDVYILVETLIKNTTPPDGHGGDAFWENSEKLLITALILYLWHVEKDESKKTFAEVARMIPEAEIKEDGDDDEESPMDAKFRELEEMDPENLAVQNYKNFKMGAGKTLKSILISVAVRLKAFNLSDIQYLTGADDFEFETFADSKQALFVIIPTADTTFNFLVSLMYSQLFTSLYTYVETRATFGWEAIIDDHNIVKVEQAYNKKGSAGAKAKIEAFVAEVKEGTVIRANKKKKLFEVYTKKKQLVGWYGSKADAEKYQEALKGLIIRQCPRRCPYHVRLILDEFANIGQIPDFDQKLATIRKYEISCSIILQAISQLKDLYKDKWNTLAANCDTKLFLGCDDSDTIEWLLKMLGKKTTTVENTSYQAGGKGGSTSYNKSSLELLTIDQITMMADDECIVRVRGERPFYGKKFELTDHRNYKQAAKTAGTFEIPFSKEAEKKSRSGPLWAQMAQKKSSGSKAAALAKEEKAAGDAHTAGDAPTGGADAPGEKKPKAGIRSGKAKNAASKAKAGKAKAAYKELAKAHEDGDGIPDEMLADGLMESLGLPTGGEMASKEQIKDAIETMIDLEPIQDSEEFTYGAT